MSDPNQAENQANVRALFPGATVEFESFEARVYCRPGVSTEQARHVINSPEYEATRKLVGHDNYVLYPGDDPDLERDSRDDLYMEVLQRPAIQMLLLAFEADLVSVTPAPPTPKPTSRTVVKK